MRPAGARAVLVELAAPADLDAVPLTPARLARAVREAATVLGVEIEEVVPGATTVLVIGGGPDGRAVRAALEQAADVVARTEPDGTASWRPDPVVIDVVYDGADLAEVAAEVGLSVEDIIARHHQGHYEAAFTGFAPGFAYLEGLDPALRVPRRPEARPSVPAGSVAIAERYSAVYPRATPGGWRLIGHTTAALWDPARTPPALLGPGTPVQFRPVPRR